MFTYTSQITRLVNAVARIVIYLQDLVLGDRAQKTSFFKVGAKKLSAENDIVLENFL